MVKTSTFTGRGRIWRDGRVALEAAGYTISCRLDTSDASQVAIRQAVPRPLTGHLHCSFPQWLIRTPIELELEDGRRWHCQIDASDGALIDRGGVYRIDGVSA